MPTAASPLTSVHSGNTWELLGITHFQIKAGARSFLAQIHTTVPFTSFNPCFHHPCRGQCPERAPSQVGRTVLPALVFNSCTKAPGALSPSQEQPGEMQEGGYLSLIQSTLRPATTFVKHQPGHYMHTHTARNLPAPFTTHA